MLRIPKAAGLESGVITGRSADLVIATLGLDFEDLVALFDGSAPPVSRWDVLKIEWDAMKTDIPGLFAAGIHRSKAMRSRPQTSTSSSALHMARKQTFIVGSVCLDLATVFADFIAPKCQFMCKITRSALIYFNDLFELLQKIYNAF